MKMELTSSVVIKPDDGSSKKMRGFKPNNFRGFQPSKVWRMMKNESGVYLIGGYKPR